MQTVQQRARNEFLGADLRAAAGSERILGADLRAAAGRVRFWVQTGTKTLHVQRQTNPESWRKMKYQDNESDSDDVEIHVIRLLLQEE